MATYTTAQMKAAGIQPAGTDRFGFPGPIVLQYELDASKKAIATNDIVTMFDIPAGSGFKVDAATVEVLAAGTASDTISIGIAGTDCTGLTAFDGATVAKTMKLATAANTIVTGAASSITLKANTAGLGSGKYVVRVFGTFFN